MKKRIKLISLSAAIIFMTASCQWLGEYYAGLTMQPDMDKDDFVPGLNVFGIIKTGTSLDTANHYFEVQQLLNLLDPYDLIELDNVDIKLWRYSQDGIQQYFKPEPLGGGRYFNGEIETSPGDRWEFYCEHDSFSVFSSCIVPQIPQVLHRSIYKNDSEISFEVLHDTTAYIYDLYLISESAYLFDRVVANRIGNTQVKMSTENVKGIENGTVFVFAYDKQFEKYFSTSSIFFKPNAYRPHFTTVDGGYGVFGAVSGASFKFD